MKKLWRTGLIGFFLLLSLVGGITLHSLIKIQSFGKLINYVGIVRGATQRLVKLELAGDQDDDMIEYLDGIFVELDTGEGPYGLIALPDPAYQDNLSKLEGAWTNLKNNIYEVRKDPSKGGALLAASEDYFNLANETVFSADEYSGRRTADLFRMILIMFTGMLITWGIIFRTYGKRLFHLESDYRHLEEITNRDPLTRAYNLKKFESEAALLLKEHPKTKYAVIYVDFADFKYINDVFGYDFGDDILKHYTELNQASLRKGEVFGRVSADNFVILRKYETKEALLSCQRAVDQKIAEYCSQPLSVNCGFCCVEDTEEALQIAGLLNRANYARKIVKNGAKRNYAFYDEGIRNRLRLEKEIEGRMQSALNNREFLVYYQPKVDVRTERIACSEALVRWRNSKGEVVSPDLFIPVFEKNFQIAKLDQYVFESICRWLRKCLDEGRTVPPVSFNVSRLQFYDSGFVATYTAIRNQYEIPPRLLQIEFTESIAFDNTQLLLKTLQELKKEGFYISVDDFGKGYSSLSLLKQVPIDELKIDRLFFMEGEDRMKDHLLVEGIVRLAKSLGIHTVAEGIEDRSKRNELMAIGCDLIQGYAYYRPLPESEYERILEEEIAALQQSG